MKGPIVCIGAAFVDELFHNTEDILPATTNVATVTRTAGGVARNIAHHLGILGVPSALISVFGADGDGDWLKAETAKAGVNLSASITTGYNGKYTGILDKHGALYTAFLTKQRIELITPEHLQQQRELLESASYILADANLSVASMMWLLDLSRETKIPLVLEPVSVPPASKFREADLAGLALMTPNEDELPVFCSERSFFTQQQIEELLGRGVDAIWLHNGKHGSALYNRESVLTLHAPEIEVLDCTGAGDGSLTGFLLGKYLGKEDLDCLRIAHSLSAEILQVNGAIAAHLDKDILLERVNHYFPHEQ